MTRRNFLFTVLGIGAIAKWIKPEPRISLKHKVEFFRNGEPIPYEKLFKGEFEQPAMGDLSYFMDNGKLICQAWNGKEWMGI